MRSRYGGVMSTRNGRDLKETSEALQAVKEDKARVRMGRYDKWDGGM